jgi:hypothetical protein
MLAPAYALYIQMKQIFFYFIGFILLSKTSKWIRARVLKQCKIVPARTRRQLMPA